MSADCEVVSGTSSLLVQPKNKSCASFPKRYPFPITRDTDDEIVPWTCVIGHLKDNCVEVSNERSMEMFFTMGFYGKGTLSRSTPQCVEKKLLNRKTKHSSKSKQKQNADSNQKKDNGDEMENPAKRRKQDEIEIVLSDNNDSSAEETDSEACTTVTTTKEKEKEVLQLTFEEAFFLSYGFGVLVVKDKDQPLDLMRLWHKFCELHPRQNFPVMYTAYHHFRSKGWIVRCGLKYGADFVLYKDGPPFYHSSYAVIVKSVKEQNLRDITAENRLNLTWSSLAALNRVCNHVSKAVLFLYIIKPAGISENKISTPFCISQFKIEEVLVHRWVPSEDRSED